MIVGGLLIVLACFVILIGTKESEASVLYYDAEFTPIAAKSEAEGAGAQDPEQAVLSGAEPAAVEEAPKMTVTVGGGTVNQKRPAKQSAPVDDIDSIRSAAQEFDPNAKQRAQAMFDGVRDVKL